MYQAPSQILLHGRNAEKSNSLSMAGISILDMSRKKARSLLALPRHASYLDEPFASHFRLAHNSGIYAAAWVCTGNFLLNASNMRLDVQLWWVLLPEDMKGRYAVELSWEGMRALAK